MTFIVYVLCKKNGTFGTVYESAKCPGPVFGIVMLKPAMRSSTLATLLDVTTSPDTVSPP